MDINRAVKEIEDFIISEDFKGYDPYDLLNSPIFNNALLKKNKFIRFYSQQLFRRIPFNLRPFLGIQKGLNPVTLGLAIQAFTYLTCVYPKREDHYKNLINKCINLLVNIKSQGYSGICWGYNFDWEARYTRIDAYVPTVVATGIITNALFEYYKVYKNKLAEDLILSSAQFALADLNRYYENGNYCLSYSPVDTQKVHNASMKGARILSQAFYFTKNELFRIEAEKIVSFTMSHQKSNGSWPYAYSDARYWVDNFHTAYVLDSLKSYISLTSDLKWLNNYNKGLKYYKNTFFNGSIPKYYSNKVYPIDSTEAAQSVITLVNNDELPLAQKVLFYSLENLYGNKGYVYYRKYRFSKDRNSYMRWSTAYMFAAISLYLSKSTGKKNE